MSPPGPSDLTRLLNALDPGAGRAERHLWLADLLAWVRAGMGEGDDPAGAVARVRLLLDAVQARPEWLPRWHAWWQLFKDTVDPAPLLADFGFAPRTAFLSDLGDRLRRKLLPVTPDTYDLINLIDYRFRATIDRDTPYEHAYDHLYWQAAGKNHATGEKTTLIQLFEERYTAEFVRTMEAYNQKNLWARFRQLPAADHRGPRAVGVRPAGHLDAALPGRLPVSCGASGRA